MSKSKEAQPQVSVIISAYNAAQFIAQTLDSVLSQTLEDIEIIVVDDGSTDDTAAIVSEYAAKDPRVSLLRQSNQFAGVARNNGMAHASGEYYYFLDADDYIEPEALALMLQNAQEHDADIVVARSNSYDNVTHEEALIDYSIQGVDIGAPLPQSVISQVAFQSFVGWPWDKLFRASFIQQHQLQFQPLRTTNDAYFTFVSLVLARTVYCMNEVLFHHRVRNGSSLENTRGKSWNCALEAARYIKDKLVEFGIYEQTRRSYENWVAHFILWNITTLDADSAEQLAQCAKTSFAGFPDDPEYYNERHDFLFAQYAGTLRNQLIFRLIEQDDRILDLERSMADNNAQLSDARREIAALRNSHSYRLGNALIRPFAKMDLTKMWEAKNKLRRAGVHAIRTAHRREPRIIVSMTSYPARIDTVHLAIRSLLAQKMLPDKIILWLCKSDFPNGMADLPASLKDVLRYDVNIRWVDEDLKPHKKYYWALQEFSNDHVITVDDDLLYRNTMIADLMATHRRHPNAVVASRTHLIMFDDNGEHTPYEQWIYEAPHYHPALVSMPSKRLFATNGAGTLYPAEAIMPAKTFDKASIRSLCLTADDLWLKVMQLKVGIPVVASTGDQFLNYVPGTQGEEALCHQNTENGVNNSVLADILRSLTSQGELPDSFDRLAADPSLDELLEP